MASSAHVRPIPYYSSIPNPSTTRPGVAPIASRCWLKRQFSRNSMYLTPKGGRVNVVKATQGTAAAIRVKKYEPTVVRPARTTYNGLYHLSGGDDQTAMYPLEMVCSYKGDGTEGFYYAEVIRQALAEVVVHFPALAGKLTADENGHFIVNCTGEGVPFVEAFVNCSVQELGVISMPEAPKLHPLLHNHEANDILDMPLLSVQVTMFKRGGFTIGTRFNHCMMDEASACAFMNSWAEIARGFPLSVPLLLNRCTLEPRQVPQTVQEVNFGSGGPEQVAVATFPYYPHVSIPQERQDRNIVSSILG